MLTDELTAEWPDIRMYADSLRDFLDALEIDHAVLIGNSFGSRVSQGFAVYHGNRVDKLVLTGVGVGKSEITTKEREELLSWRTNQIQMADFPMVPDGCHRYLEVEQATKRMNWFATCCEARTAAGFCRRQCCPKAASLRWIIFQRSQCRF